MSINIICGKCKKTFKVDQKRCACGNSLTGSRRRYKVRLQTPSGKWLSKVVHSFDMAQKVEAKFRTTVVEESVFNIFPSPTVEAIWTRYLKFIKVNKGTWKDDLTRWTLHVQPYLKGPQGQPLLMDKVTPNDVSTIITQMKERKTPKGTRYSPATIQQVLTLIRRLFNWAYKEGLYHSTNPCDKVENLKFDNRLTDNIPPGELKVLLSKLNTWPNVRASLIAQFLLLTGKRRGEVLKLKWTEVDIDNSLVTFKSTTTKNKVTQILPMNRHAMDILKRASQIRISPYVFPCSTGKPYIGFDKVWQRFKKKHDFTFRLHSLRHTYASMVISSGDVSLYELQHLLGHRSSKLTQRYASLHPQAIKKSVDVTDKVFDIDVPDEEILEMERETERLLKLSQAISERRG